MATTPYYLRKADGSYLLLSTGGRLIIGQQTITDACFFDAPIEDRTLTILAEVRVFDVPTQDRILAIATEVRAFDVPAESRVLDMAECA